MDKSIKLAVAGSGKTSSIIKGLSREEKTLVITYTNNNQESIKNRIERKFSKIPGNIEVLTFFNFLYQFCFNPFLSDKVEAKGIEWDYPPKYTRYLKTDNYKHYLSKGNLLYHNRISKMILEFVDIEKILSRLEKYYSVIYLDEVQDVGGYDFDLLMKLIETNVSIKLVGDFYQHTYSTSHDGRKNSNLHESLDSYISRFENKNVNVDEENLNKSWRCSETVCEFIRDKLGIEIYSHNERNSEVLYTENHQEVSDIYKNQEITKLFYRSSDSYSCQAKNWGEAKGDDQHQDVCVVLNKKSTRFYKKDKLEKLPFISRNKLYVACSRPNNNLYLVPQRVIEEL